MRALMIHAMSVVWYLWLCCHLIYRHDVTDTMSVLKTLVILCWYVEHTDNSDRCLDSDACTVDSCDPVQGCIAPAKFCFDLNLCTNDLCDSGSGCHYEAIDRSDNNICTTDSCESSTGVWTYTDISGDCFDNNFCTDDFCDPVLSCN
eukprot:TRINITY_DN8995_c0_g1_i1.p1 TRINITY_DN8995_c0_g1~~TRINITY_DN8995_c0_g1_i1.p1  ORF type:complete len:147 (+),score=6.49 TRINITY_DN8995_c0_g1_i1:24-464(+)